MIVDPSELSKQDVIEIAQYIAQDNMSAALRFLEGVDETYATLADFPAIGHTPVFDLVDDMKTVLVKGFKHYHVYYRVLDDVIRIDRVADGRRHMPSLFTHLDDNSS